MDVRSLMCICPAHESLDCEHSTAIHLDEDGFPQGDEANWDNYGPDGVHQVFVEHADETLCGLPTEPLYKFAARITPMDESLQRPICETAALTDRPN
jgi:hypothetical protein